MVQPYFARLYHAFRDMFNFDARKSRRWRGTVRRAVRRTARLAFLTLLPAQYARRSRDARVSWWPCKRAAGRKIADLWRPGYLDDDGWRLELGKVYARGGYVDLEFDTATATLLSPPDQVIRAATTDTLILGLQNPSPLAAVQIFARLESGAPWISLGEPVAAARFGHTAAGVGIPLTWPPAWRRNGAIARNYRDGVRFRRRERPPDRIALCRSRLRPVSALAEIRRCRRQSSARRLSYLPLVQPYLDNALSRTCRTQS